MPMISWLDKEEYEEYDCDEEDEDDNSNSPCISFIVLMGIVVKFTVS